MGALIQARISKKKEYDNIFAQGKSAFSKFLGIKALSNKGLYNRFGIIVSTKISKKAVERNLIKRQVREILRALNNSLEPGNDLVVITLPQILGKKIEQIKQEIESNLIKLKILIKKP